MVGTQSITATDSGFGLANSETGIVVTPSVASHLFVTGFPNPTGSGITQLFTVDVE